MSSRPILARAARSVKGASRSVNQDRLAVDEELGFVLVADGVAGPACGERAAEVAITAVCAQLGLALQARPPNSRMAARLFNQAFQLANLAVRRAAVIDDSLGNMATTLVGALFVEGHAVICNLGDSHAYRWRSSFLKQITCAHDTRARLLHPADPRLALGEQGVLGGSCIQLTARAMGHSSDPEPFITVEPLVPDDVFLLCSNGLSNVLSRERMAELLVQCDTLDEACDSLVRAALDAGAEDDVTIVLVQPHVAREREEAQCRTWKN